MSVGFSPCSCFYHLMSYASYVILSLSITFRNSEALMSINKKLRDDDVRENRKANRGGRRDWILMCLDLHVDLTVDKRPLYDSDFRPEQVTRVYKIVAEGGRGAQPPSTHPSPPYIRQSPLQYHKCAFSYFLTQWTNCSTDGPKEGRTKSLIRCVFATKKEKQKPEMFEFTTAV